MTPSPVRCAPGLLDPNCHEEFCSGMFSDELDLMGYRHQVAAEFLMNNRALRCFGRARTVRLETIETDDERIELGLGFLESLAPGDVLVVEGSSEYAYFGELMSRLSLRGDAAGVVIDGLTRDSIYTQRIELPIFCRGYSPVDIKGRGRVAEVDGAVDVGGISCNPGDYIFGDSDAVVVVPQTQLQEVIGRVNKGAQHEQSLKQCIADGMSVKEILKRTAAF